MSDILGISGNAVMAYQLALGTVSNNIANVSTDGYSRQGVELQAGAPTQVGTAFIGSGVVFDRVRRQYDAFAETNLRNSNSDMQSQAPLVDYANRVIDILGGQTSGLSSSLDQFYASARALSADPASTVLRGAFVRDAQGVTSRFGQLSGQLDLIDTETRESVDASLGQVNTLTQQLADINKQLSKQTSVDRQPAALLDQRDSLLRDLSQFARLNTSISSNGTVKVSLGASIDQDVIINGQIAVRLGANYNAAAPEKIGLVLDPYGSPSSLSGVTSGKLAGLLTFREQVLGSTRTSLDFVAKTLVNEVNTIHREGVDAYGDLGGDLFVIDPAAKSVAGGLSVAVTDPLRIAAAAQFRVSKDPGNTSNAGAMVSYQAQPATGPAPLDQVLVNNGTTAADKTFPVGGAALFTPVTTIPAGMKDVAIYLDNASGDQQLSLVTRDGRQLLGPSLNSSQQTTLMAQSGFAAGATYSASYLGQSGQTNYRDMAVFYGARAAVSSKQNFEMDPHAGVQGQVTAGVATPMPAVLSGERMASGLTSFAPGVLSLNGIALNAATPAPSHGSTLQADELASWLNQPAVTALGITATASNDVRASVAQLKLDKPLVINGQSITTPAGGFADAQALVTAINAKSASTGVQAGLSQGELVLSNMPGQEGRDILVEPVMPGSANALNVAGGLYKGRVALTRELKAGFDTPIEMSFAGSGQPADLAKLGFRTAAYIRGDVPDDVMVFVSSSSASVGKASVAASYSGSPADTATALRANPMQLDFVAGGTGGTLRYRITDTLSGTVLAERNLEPARLQEGIQYAGLQVSFTSMPVAGDSFTLDGNKDGTGNNENMLRLLKLESKPLVGSKSIGEAYIDHVNDMGNVSRQSSIALDALQVVHDQAVESRDKVSGVSLDEEAANLIRFQQAYQASAKVMQVATALFDAVLAVR